MPARLPRGQAATPTGHPVTYRDGRCVLRSREQFVRAYRDLYFRDPPEQAWFIYRYLTGRLA